MNQMPGLEMAREAEPVIAERWMHPAAPAQPRVAQAQPAWVPRPGGVDADGQRALRRSLAASGSGVPEAWTRVSGAGCPGWWLRLAADTAWS